MSVPQYGNNVSTTLASAVSSGATSLSLTSATDWSSPDYSAPYYNSYQWATITDGTNVEIVRIKSRSGTTLTVDRGEQGTSARAWDAGVAIQNRWTADDGVFRIPSAFPISLVVDGDAMISRNNGVVYLRWSGTDYPLVRSNGGSYSSGTLPIWDGGTGGIVVGQSAWGVRDNAELFPSTDACRLVVPTYPVSAPAAATRGRIWIDHTTDRLMVDTGATIKTIALV